MFPAGDLMLMWRKDDQLVALHDQVLTTNGRLSVEKVEQGSLLSVMLAEREDGGVRMDWPNGQSRAPCPLPPSPQNQLKTSAHSATAADLDGNF